MSGAVALVTGVSRREGLGCAVARQLTERGFDVVVTARDLRRARAVADDLSDGRSAVHAATLDVTLDASVSECLEELGDRFGRLDVLINNAAGGFDPEQNVLDVDFDIVRQALEINLIGPWRTALAALPLLRSSPSARIVNVSAEAGSLTSANGLTNDEFGELIPAYSLSKTVLTALTVKMAHALRGSGILVNAVCPGHTATHPETGDEDGARSATDSAAGVVWAATLPADGPTGGFFRDGEPLPW